MQDLTHLKQWLDAHHVTLVAVSKTQSLDAIQSLYNKGQRHFGENKVQELLSKADALPKDIQWHLIGHLQTNKVKQLLPYVYCIHSVDSLKLLQEIRKEAEKQGCCVNVLLQIHIAQEETKFGLDKTELIELLDAYFADPKMTKHVQLCGLMGMATNTQDEIQIRNEFKNLKNLFDFVRQGYFIHSKAFREISMGMSSDYQIAVQEGATLVRIGSLLFGSRS